jgi:hypothetical protein
MKAAIIKIKCANGETSIPVETLEQLGEITRKFDKAGTEYSIEYPEGTEKKHLGAARLAAYLEHTIKAAKYSDGELIDECVAKLMVFEPGSFEEALFDVLLNRFQSAVALDITPAGITIDGEAPDDEWADEITVHGG